MTSVAKNLFTPIRLGALSLKHRVVFPAMSRLRAVWPSAVPSDLMIDYYGQRATEGGLIITEANAVSPAARAYHTGPGLYSDEQVATWRRLTDAVHARGGFIFAQLSHAGRVTSVNLTGEQPVSASVDPAIWANESIVVSTPDGFQLPSPHRALEVSEIAAIVEQFRAAAKNAQRAGFDGVELLGGNAHLVEQFLHDGANTRADAYGGSLENRTRFTIQVLRAMIDVFGADRVGLRVSPSSVFGGMGDSDPHALYGYLAERLNDLGLAYLHVIEPRVSGADTVDPAQAPVAAEALNAVFTGPIIAAGGFNPASADAVLDKGDAALVAFGRHFTSNPDLPHRIRHGYPLTPYERDTFYGGGAKGYTDFGPYVDARERADA